MCTKHTGTNAHKFTPYVGFGSHIAKDNTTK